MKAIEMYQSDDGKKFVSKADCLLHEKICKERDSVLNELFKVPEEINFTNGDGYVQYDLHWINNLKLKYLKLIEVNTEWAELKKAINAQRGNLYAFGILGRYLDDGNSEFYSGYCRLFGNIDEQGREWGQMYFRLNPDKAKQVQLNLNQQPQSN